MLSIMFRLSAILTILCLGCLLPLAGSPLRVCILEQEERSEDCCTDCGEEDKECCLDVQPIPPGPLVKGIFETPDFSAQMLDASFALPAAPPEIFAFFPRMVCPPPCCGPPSAHRALLNVWRL
jgi:hypothetical protein